MSEELEQDQSVIIWPTPIYHRKLSKDAQASIKSLMTPFIDDEIMDENAFHLSKQKSSIRNDKNATLPWDKYITHLRPHFYSFWELVFFWSGGWGDYPSTFLVRLLAPPPPKKKKRFCATPLFLP